jgi:phosphate transport system permease protein
VQRSALSWDFFTKTAATFGQSGGGVANALVGSIVIVALATAMAVPVGILIALYVSEFAPPRIANLCKLVSTCSTGCPRSSSGSSSSALLVLGSGQAAWKGSFALAIIMLPLIARATQEGARSGSQHLARRSSRARRQPLAHGRRGRSPTSIGGILTGTVLAVARAAGETAPLLFTTSIAANEITWDPRQPLLSIPVDIFALSESPDPADHARAWALGFVLIAFVS